VSVATLVLSTRTGKPQPVDRVTVHALFWYWESALTHTTSASPAAHGIGPLVALDEPTAPSTCPR
jgi:hypothetical protein